MILLILLAEAAAIYCMRNLEEFALIRPGSMYKIKQLY